MKKIILLMFSVLCVNSFSYVERNDQVGNRGLELMRESNINQNMGLSKESGSTQIIDAYAGNGKFSKTKGLMIGTTSNLVAYPNITAGVTVAYDKYKYKPESNNYWGRDYDLNTYFSYKLDKNLFTLGLGYSQSRHVEKRGYTGNLEYGRFLTPSTYLYAGIEGQNRNYKNSEDLNFVNYKVGVLRQDTWKKLKFVNGVEFNMDNKKYDREERGRGNVTFVSRASYYIYDDLLFDVQYRGTKNSKFYDNVVGVGFTHYF